MIYSGKSFNATCERSLKRVISPVYPTLYFPYEHVEYGNPHSTARMHILFHLPSGFTDIKLPNVLHHPDQA